MSFFTRMSPPASTMTVCNMVTYSVSIQSVGNPTSPTSSLSSTPFMICSMANLSTIMIPSTLFISIALLWSQPSMYTDTARDRAGSTSICLG